MGKWIAAQLHVMAGTGIRTPVPMVTYAASYQTELSPSRHVRVSVRGVSRSGRHADPAARRLRPAPTPVVVKPR